MSAWTAVVVADNGQDDGMKSRLPTWLHPAAGRPLLWHAVAALVGAERAPSRVVILAGSDLPPDLLGDFPVPIDVAPAGARGLAALDPDDLPLLLVEGRAVLDPAAVSALLAAEGDAWVGVGPDAVAARVASPETLRALATGRSPLAAIPALEPASRLPDAGSSLLVRTREDLGHLSRRVRDRLVRALMDGGVTFLLPESVLVDVDVRIGRDSIIYPGVVLEGTTTIGDETVVGPGCRIIDSWVGSGVELKGWNYISRTSVRNRAILEPYVRRGFD